MVKERLKTKAKKFVANTYIKKILKDDLARANKALMQAQAHGNEREQREAKVAAFTAQARYDQYVEDGTILSEPVSVD